MRKEFVGPDPKTGAAVYHYIADINADGVPETLIHTGPIVAKITLADGTDYDVSEPYVAVTEEHHDELVDAINSHYETNGHPGHKDGYPFTVDWDAVKDGHKAHHDNYKALVAAAKKGK